MLKNNKFSADTHVQHADRSETCASSIDEYKAELGLREAWVDEIKAHAASMQPQLNRQNITDAEYHGAVADLKDIKRKLQRKITAARRMARTVVSDPELGPDTQRMVYDMFQLGKPGPSVAFAQLADWADTIIAGQEKLVELALPWRLPDPFVAEIADMLEKMTIMREQARIAKGVKTGATNKLLSMRRRGNALLLNIYRWTVSVWDIDDPRLLALGFLPKSSIWTPHKKKSPAENAEG